MPARRFSILSPAALILMAVALLAIYPPQAAAKNKAVAKGRSDSETGSPTGLPREALIGWAVNDAATGESLESHQGDMNFTPGSTQKLFTTWIALQTLGGSKTYATELFRAGEMEGDRLHGDLVIKGGGDPSFAGAQFGPAQGQEAVFSQWLRALQTAGIRRIDGCVIGDGAYLAEEGPHPAGLWEDAGNYYAGTVSGLSFNDNIYSLAFNGAGAPGKTVVLQGASPPHIGIARFDNRLLTGPVDGHDSAFILGGFPSPVRLLRGTFPAGRMPFAIKGSLPNPPWTCARELRAYLAAKGILFTASDDAGCGDSLAFPNHAEARTTAAIPGTRHESPPLRELLRIVNQKSDNNYAAQTLALLGKGTGRSGDWRGGLAAIYAYLDEHGFNRKLVHLKDGNGLSRYNWIAPSQTVKLLACAYGSKEFPEFQATLLGAPGSAGKLARYGAGWEGRLFAKTGTLEGVSALAGYVKTASGRWLAFAIAANNFEANNGDAQKYFAPLVKGWAAKY